MSHPEDTKVRPRHGKRERYLQPSILLGLYLQPSHGYELIRNLQAFGFVEGQAPPGMIYRHLHQLEEEGLVASEWKLEAAGPAKRIYRLTHEGKEMLALWIDHMENQARTLNAFVQQYRDLQTLEAKRQEPEENQPEPEES